MISNLRLNLPKLAIALVLLVNIVIDLDLKLWTKTERVIEHDVHNYYGYLPLFFIYDDLKIEKSDYKYGDNLYWIWNNYTEDGRKIIKMTSGLAILYSPFFGMAHLYATFSNNYDADGFSTPYKIALLISALVYLWLGLFVLSKLLSKLKFSNKAIAISILLIGIGTNLLCFSSQSAGYSHVYSFTLFASFLYFSYKWVLERKFWQSFLLAFLLGFIVLIRPTNGIIALSLVLWKKPSNTWKEHFLELIEPKTLKHFLIFPFVAIIPWIPQLLYWHFITGNYIHYSYGEEGFFFSNPKIIKGLFSFRKGWLIYTPIMAFSLIGLFYLKNEIKQLRPLIIGFTLINIYILFSWWCWWYGGCFGQRAMIESYALLTIPLTAFISFILKNKNKAIKILSCVLALFFIWLNIFQTYQFEKQTLHWDGMTRELYFKQFGKMNKIDGFWDKVDSPDYGAALKGEEE